MMSDISFEWFGRISFVIPIEVLCWFARFG